MSLFDKMLTNNYSIFDKEIDKQPSKKRKISTNQKPNNKQPKKKKINENHENIDNEITSKTSYTYNNTKTEPTLNSIFKSENESFFISNDDLFDKYMEKEKEKYKENNKNKNHHHQNRNDDNTQLLTNELLNFFCNGGDDCNNNNNNNGYEIEDLHHHQNDSESLSSHKSYSDEIYYNENSYDDEEEDDENECFLCSWGNSAHDGIYSQHLQKLRDIYIKNRAYVQDEALALMLHLYFKENVWDPRINGMPMLTSRNALMHIRNFGKTHTLNASEHVIESIRFWSKVHQNLSKSLFRQDEKIDKDQFNCLKETQKLLDGFYSKDISKLNFIDPDMRIDTTGSLFKIKTFNINDENIIKNKRLTQKKIQDNRTLDIS